MKDKLIAIVANFQANIDKIETLLKFEEVLQEFCLARLKKADEALTKFKIDNPRFDIKPAIKEVEKIRQNASMKHSYEIMYNQCVVLLVSYFSSAVEDIFKEIMRDKLDSGSLTKIEDEEIRVTISQFKTGDIAEIFVQKKDDINFQDMRSTLRSFEDYLGFKKTERDEIIDNIILAQAMRHCIVHNGCKTNEKCIRQLRDANKRSLKQDLKNNSPIQFQEEEVHRIQKNMLNFINRLITSAYSL